AGPVLIELRMFHPIPRSWSKKRQAMALVGEVMPTVKCDADNCLKAVCDALNGVAWKDDTQVVNVMLAKRYAEVPRVEVKIVPLMAQGAQR
ncbi:RusA family crossover junction endodeoxyribonuclease, partial [Pseudomonas aeruginosa]|nr:RusA family crossover junction endodeoxyribonuclease [Pseudomonas aeruginosa]